MARVRHKAKSYYPVIFMHLMNILRSYFLLSNHSEVLRFHWSGLTESVFFLVLRRLISKGVFSNRKNISKVHVPHKMNQVFSISLYWNWVLNVLN